MTKLKLYSEPRHANLLGSFVQQFPWMYFAKYVVYVTWPTILLSTYFITYMTAHACLEVMRDNHEKRFRSGFFFIPRHSNHRFNYRIPDSRYSAMHKRCPGTPFSVNLTTPSDIFEAISSKFVRTSTPNSHVEVRRPISAHGANYMTSLANSPVRVQCSYIHCTDSPGQDASPSQANRGNLNCLRP